jgi:predicted secreted protein
MISEASPKRLTDARHPDQCGRARMTRSWNKATKVRNLALITSCETSVMLSG